MTAGNPSQYETTSAPAAVAVPCCTALGCNDPADAGRNTHRAAARQKHPAPNTGLLLGKNILPPAPCSAPAAVAVPLEQGRGRPHARRGGGRKLQRVRCGEAGGRGAAEAAGGGGQAGACVCASRPAAQRRRSSGAPFMAALGIASLSSGAHSLRRKEGQQPQLRDPPRPAA